MSDLSILAGATSQSILVDLYILATGAPQTALVYNSTALTAYYSFAGANATSTAITLATLAGATSAWSSGGFIKLDDTNMPGVYRFDVPNAVIAASKGREVIVTFTGYSGMATRHIKLELTGWDNQNANSGGLGVLPASAVPGAAGGLFIAGTNAATTITTSLTTHFVGTIDTLTTYTGNTLQTVDAATIKTVTDKFAFTVANQVDANALKVGGTTQTGRDLGASVLLSAGTGTGQLDFTSGVVKANLAQILGTALTETVGQIAAAFKQFFNIGAPTSTMNEITLVDTITTYTGNTKQTGDAYSVANTRLPAALTGAGNMKSDALALNGSTVAATQIGLSGQKIGNGTVGSASSTTSIVTSSITPANVVAGQFTGRVVIFDNSTTTTALRGQATVVSTDNGSGTLTVVALTTAPVSGDTFTIT